MAGPAPLKAVGRRRSLLSAVISTFLLCITVGFPAGYVLLSSAHMRTPEYEAASRHGEQSLGRGLLQAGAQEPSESPLLTVTPLATTPQNVIPVPTAARSEGPVVNCADPSPNACFNANGSAYVCCLGDCAVPPGANPLCAQISPPVNTQVCSATAPNPCYAADGLSFTCCPGLCGTPPGEAAWCSDTENSTGLNPPTTVVNSPTLPPNPPLPSSSVSGNPIPSPTSEPTPPAQAPVSSTVSGNPVPSLTPDPVADAPGPSPTTVSSPVSSDPTSAPSPAMQGPVSGPVSNQPTAPAPASNEPATSLGPQQSPVSSNPAPAPVPLGNEPTPSEPSPVISIPAPNPAPTPGPVINSPVSGNPEPNPAPAPGPVASGPVAQNLGNIPQVVVSDLAAVGSLASPIGAVTQLASVTLAPAPPSSPAKCMDSTDDVTGPGNLISNPGFASGIPTGWAPFGPATLTLSPDSTYVAATNRQLVYAGPSWEISPATLPPGSSFTGQIWVQLSSGVSIVDLTMLIITNGDHEFERLGSVTASTGCWTQLGGAFTLPGGADQLILYVEGAPVGADIYVRSAALFPSAEVGNGPGTATPPGFTCIGSSRNPISGTNLVDDSRNLIGWTCAGCIFNYSSDHSYTIATSRGATYDGPTWSLNGKLSVGLPNSVQVWVQLGGQVNSAPVKLTAKKSSASTVDYKTVDEAIAYAGCWTQLSGTYTLDGPSDQVAIYVEGPEPGVDEWVASPAVFLPGSYGVPVPKVPQTNVCPGSGHDPITGTNLIYSPGFYGGAPGGWSCFGCTLAVDPLVKNYITAIGRSATWQGPSWILTGKLGQGSTYALQVVVRVSTGSAPVQLTIHSSLNGQADVYTPVATGVAQTDCWTQLNGTFTLTSTADSVIMYVEGAPAGVDVSIMVAAAVLTVPALTIRPRPSNVCPDSLNVPPPVNSIVENPGFQNGIPKTWLPFGTCDLTISGDQQYIIAANRQQTFAGPSWDVTNLVRQGNFYRFSAWVSLPAGSTSRILYGVAVTKNGVTNFYCGGQNTITGGCWSQLNGGYNLYQDSPEKVVIYMQGPAPGINILVQSVNVEPLSREAWLQDVTIRTDQIRKTNVIVNVQDQNGNPVPGAQIKIDQTRQGFPLGLAINYQLPDNPRYQEYVKQRFNWAVFENEAKWYFNENQQGVYNYEITDRMVAWAQENDIKLRGHCVFWEDTQTVQPWARALDNTALKASMDVRLNQVVDRYKGVFKHWDVDNEALHNSYFSGRLGPAIQSWMYETTQERDPSVQMFINEYNVIEECEVNANPATFIAQAADLEAQGFQVSFGCQSHFGNPVQAYKLRAELDKLASFGRPIWITEMDSAEVDEQKKADMLEFAYREYFAHPAVEGILMWTVWEGPATTCQVCTVNGDFTNKPSGARVDQLLLDEWRTTGVTGQTDNSGDPFIFRGFYGDYSAEITYNGQTYTDQFTVLKEESGNVVYVTIPVSVSGRRKLLTSEPKLRRSRLTSPERKLPASYVTEEIPGDALNPVNLDPVKPSRSILSRQALDAATVVNEADGYASLDVTHTKPLEHARAIQRSLLESEGGIPRLAPASVISRQEYDAALFHNRELLEVKDTVSEPGFDSAGRSLLTKMGPMHAYLGLGKGFDYVRLELEEDPGYHPTPNESQGVNAPKRRLLEVEAAENEKNEYLDTLMYYGGEQANATEATIAFLREQKVASRLRRNRQRMLRYGPAGR